MKIGAASPTHLAVIALSIAPATGCEERQTFSTQPTQTVSAKEDPALKALEAKAGISLPTNTVLVTTDDGGGRDPSYGFTRGDCSRPLRSRCRR